MNLTLYTCETNPDFICGDDLDVNKLLPSWNLVEFQVQYVRHSQDEKEECTVQSVRPDWLSPGQAAATWVSTFVRLNSMCPKLSVQVRCHMLSPIFSKQP